MAPRETDPGDLETDAVFLVGTAIKGRIGGKEIVVSQRGGRREDLVVTPAQYSMLEPGEEYILFLIENPKGAISREKTLKHYWVVGAWYGLFPFESGRMRVKAQTPDAFRQAFEGMTIEQVIAELRKEIP